MFTAGSALVRGMQLDRRLAFWRRELGLSSALSARVVSVHDETHDVRTLVLEPNRPIAHPRPGQHVTLDAEIDGVRTRRCYSIASAEGVLPAGRFAITVKLQGRMSSFLHSRRPGDVLGLGAPAGEFVLPERSAIRRTPMFFLSGGSGITPVMSMLRSLLRTRAAPLDVVFLHCARSSADVIFARELGEIATGTREHGVRVIVRTDASCGGPLDEASLRTACPDFAERATYLCGPASMMNAVAAIYARASASARLHRETFGAPSVVGHDAGAAGLELRLARSRRAIAMSGAGSLLEELERAGERPTHGCRMGVCHTCRCTKKKGVVMNRLTGELSSDEAEEIRLCVSVARSNVELSL